MALIVEDGTGKADAETYATVEEATAYIEKRGGVVDPAKIEAQLLNAATYIDMQERRYSGTRSVAGQALSWPRTAAIVAGGSSPTDEVPALVKRIQMQLVLEQINGVDLFPSRSSGAFVKREKVDVIETEYSETIGTSLSPEMTSIDGLIIGLYGSTGLKLRTQRI